MGSNPLFKVPTNKYFRIGALIYGLVLCNAGALLLYDRLSRSPFSFDANFRMGIGCLILGGIGLFVARLSKQQS